jgi:hypothetical protein
VILTTDFANKEMATEGSESTEENSHKKAQKTSAFAEASARQAKKN